MVRQEPWKDDGANGATPNVPSEAFTLERAFRANGSGGMEIAVGVDITDDPFFEDNGSGGIQLSLTT